jgi:general secretion pathway protein M
MKSTLPTGRYGQILAVAVALLAVVLFCVTIVSPLAAWYAERADMLGQRQALLAREAALVKTLPALRRMAREAANRPLPFAVLNCDTDAYASASLQMMVQDLAGKAGATFTSVGILPGAPVGAYQRVGLQIAMTATWPIIIHLLQAIETATPHLLVDDLTLHSSVMPQVVNDLSLHSSDVSPADSVDMPIQASFAVVAFRSPPAVPPRQ